MIEPVEAEMAQPPIFTNKQEKILRDEDIELPNAISREGTVVANGGPASPDVEKAGGRIIVDFEPGAHEDPREWSKGKKWYSTLACSFLCLAVALGSSMPTGDLGSQAEEFGVGNIPIFLSISLFVLGFGIGPLAFAPRKSLLFGHN